MGLCIHLIRRHGKMGLCMHSMSLCIHYINPSRHAALTRYFNTINSITNLLTISITSSITNSTTNSIPISMHHHSRHTMRTSPRNITNSVTNSITKLIRYLYILTTGNPIDSLPQHADKSLQYSKLNHELNHELNAPSSYLERRTSTSFAATTRGRDM